MNFSYTTLAHLQSGSVGVQAQVYGFKGQGIGDPEAGAPLLQHEQSGLEVGGGDEGGHLRVDSGRGQDRTLRGKAPVRHVPPLRYPFIPAGAALSVRGSSSGRRSRSPRPPPNRNQERLI